MTERKDKDGFAFQQKRGPGGGRRVPLGLLIGILIAGSLATGGYVLLRAGSNDAGGVTPSGEPPATGGAQPTGQGGDQSTGQGEAEVTVPGLVGMTQEEATSMLSAAGLRPKVQAVANPSRIGLVLSQMPAPDTLVAPGSVVLIAVGVKTKNVVVPDLVGMTQDEAVQALAGVGLTLGTVFHTSDQAPAGQVLDQNPAAGKAPLVNNEVNLVVSTGPARVDVPNVVCLTVSVARQILDARGLKMSVQGKKPAPQGRSCQDSDRIVVQKPVEGSSLTTGGSVRVWTGKP